MLVDTDLRRREAYEDSHDEKGRNLEMVDCLMRIQRGHPKRTRAQMAIRWNSIPQEPLSRSPESRSQRRFSKTSEQSAGGRTRVTGPCGTLSQTLHA